MARLRTWGNRKDANHEEIKALFEKLLCKVLDISDLPGCCDIVVKRGKDAKTAVYRFVEIKDPSQPPSNRKLTKDEKDFHDEWGGVCLVMTLGDVIQLVGEMVEQQSRASQPEIRKAQNDGRY